MMLSGENNVVKLFLSDLNTKRPSPHTITSYVYILRVLVSILETVCGVTELERVTVIHLRQCVEHLLTAPVALVKSYRLPDNGKTLSIATVRNHVKVWKVVQGAYAELRETPENFGRIIRERCQERNLEKALAGILGYASSMAAWAGGEFANEENDLSVFLHYLADKGGKRLHEKGTDFGKEVQRKRVKLHLSEQPSSVQTARLNGGM